MITYLRVIGFILCAGIAALVMVSGILIYNYIIAAEYSSGIIPAVLVCLATIVLLCPLYPLIEKQFDKKWF